MLDHGHRRADYHGLGVGDERSARVGGNARFHHLRPGRDGVTPRLHRLLILTRHLRGIVALHDGLLNALGRFVQSTLRVVLRAARNRSRTAEEVQGVLTMPPQNVSRETLLSD